jgi:aminoglycoside phosphotransferase (APT) family kinase protein
MELRRTSVPDHVRDWVKDMTGSTVVRTRRLQGASSAALHRLDLADGSRLVLRRYAWRAYVAAEPDAPRRETDALCFARGHGLAVPELVAADVTGDHVGDGVPVVLVTFLSGRPEAVPDVERLAEVAGSIHEIRADDLGHEYFPWYEEEMTAPPPLTERRGLWELAIELWRSALPEYRPRFIHRDFHPGNLLWARTRLTGIVDWSAACRGPIGCDIAHCRANLRDLADAETGDRFVAAYTAATGEALDPFWVMAGRPNTTTTTGPTGASTSMNLTSNEQSERSRTSRSSSPSIPDRRERDTLRHLVGSPAGRAGQQSSATSSAGAANDRLSGRGTSSRSHRCRDVL